MECATAEHLDTCLPGIVSGLAELDFSTAERDERMAAAARWLRWREMPTIDLYAQCLEQADEDGSICVPRFAAAPLCGPSFPLSPEDAVGVALRNPHMRDLWTAATETERPVPAILEHRVCDLLEKTEEQIRRENAAEHYALTEDQLEAFRDELDLDLRRLRHDLPAAGAGTFNAQQVDRLAQTVRSMRSAPNEAVRQQAARLNAIVIALRGLF
ncbi:hypothetical protein P0L94_11080 [Microbacter sp. GSS18]|nr:hypothetical protein P0L94_11080 [Microbacter sp. GSS18]